MLRCEMKGSLELPVLFILVEGAISFWGGRISGTPVPCIVVDDAIHKLLSTLTLKLQYQVWCGRILELKKPCFEAEDAFGHLEL